MRIPPAMISWTLRVAVVLLLGGCGGDDATRPPAGNPNLVEAVIGPAGGSLRSSDGVLTLELRPLAFSAPTRVSIETLVAKDSSYRIDAENPAPSVAARVQWELGPWTLPPDRRATHPFTWLLVSAEEPVPQAVDQRLLLDDVEDRRALSAEITSLDVILSREEEALVLGMGPVPRSGLAGTLFELEVELEQSLDSRVSAQPRYRDGVEMLAPPRALELVELVEGSLPAILAGEARSDRKTVAQYRWENVPAGRFQGELHLENFSVGGLEWMDDWVLELFVPVRGEEIAPGEVVFPARTAFPTDLIVALLPWGPITEDGIVGVVGSDGVPFLDVDTGFLWNGDLLGLQSLRGGIALSNAATAAGPLLEALFLYGSGGAGLSNWAWGLGEFTPLLPIEEGAEVFDAAPYGGVANSGGLCYAMPSLNEVRFVEVDPSGERFERAELRIEVDGFPGAPGPVISAYRREPAGEVLVLCEGSPGALYAWDPADSSIVEIAGVGNGPTRVRGRDELVVVSNFDDQNLVSFHWPLGGTPVRRASFEAAGGPKGFDLRPVGGAYELVTTGFSTNLLYRYGLSSSGSPLTSENLPLPEGCSGPSTAVFLLGDRVVVAGFTSGTLARIEP